MGTILPLNALHVLADLFEKTKASVSSFDCEVTEKMKNISKEGRYPMARN